jgi:hypothetical protein
MTVCGVVDFYQFLEECASSVIWLKNTDIFGLVRYVVNLWNGGGMLLQNSGRFLPDYTVPYA